MTYCTIFFKHLPRHKTLPSLQSHLKTLTMRNDVYIVSSCRTAIGKYLGQFGQYSATELGAFTVTEALHRATLQPHDVDLVVMGQTLTAGQGQNPARQTSLKAHLPNSVPAYTVNMLCGSGLKSVCLAFQAIQNGDNDIVVAGGQESMSKAHHSAGMRGINRIGPIQLVDTLLIDGLTDAFHNIHMGKTAEHLAKKYQVSRESQDKFAMASQNKTQQAMENGYFEKEIVAIAQFDKDEFPKFDTTLSGLSKLRPAFDSNGTVTAGNASGVNDGAAVVVLSSFKKVKERNLKPLAKILAFAEVGLDPMEMGLGPIEAVKEVLKKVSWSKDDVDLYELNEAFAVQSIIVVDTLQLEKKKVNVAGGAIALGHPIGASGARILVTLIHNLERMRKKKGVAALCVGGGMGIAVAIEMC